MKALCQQSFSSFDAVTHVFRKVLVSSAIVSPHPTFHCSPTFATEPASTECSSHSRAKTKHQRPHITAIHQGQAVLRSRVIKNHCLLIHQPFLSASSPPLLPSSPQSHNSKQLHSPYTCSRKICPPTSSTLSLASSQSQPVTSLGMCNELIVVTSSLIDSIRRRLIAIQGSNGVHEKIVRGSVGKGAKRKSEMEGVKTKKRRIAK